MADVASGENEESSGTERKWKSTIDREALEEKDHRDMTRKECMAVIGFEIASRGYQRTELGKEDLNSIHWAVTGEQIAPWIDFGTERSPDLIDLREAVAEGLGFKYGRFERHPDSEKLCWLTESLSDVGGDEPRPFRRSELRAIVYKLRSTEDKRDG
jgi:hypothetical protein